jgi:hypothetical protein
MNYRNQNENLELYYKIKQISNTVSDTTHHDAISGI